MIILASLSTKMSTNLNVFHSVLREHIYRDGRRIEFRDANNLRMTLLSYKPKVRPGCLAVAPPSLLFYEEIPSAELINNNWKQRDFSGEVRTLDCSTNPPKPGITFTVCNIVAAR